MHVQELFARLFPYTTKVHHLNLIGAVEHHPYQYLFVLIAIEEAGVPLPVPGDAFLLLFGVWSRQGKASFLDTFIVVSIATLVGSTILYYLAWYFGRPLVERFGKYIHVSHDQLLSMEKWMGKYGGLAVALARLTPGLRIVSTLAAGVLKLPYRAFVIANLAATWVWITVYFYIGVFVGKRYGVYIDFLLSHQLIALLLALFGFIGWIIFLRYIAPYLHRQRQQLKDWLRPSTKAS